jgi:hypothetical protein
MYSSATCQVVSQARAGRYQPASDRLQLAARANDGRRCHGITTRDRRARRCTISPRTELLRTAHGVRRLKALGWRDARLSAPTASVIDRLSTARSGHSRSPRTFPVSSRPRQHGQVANLHKVASLMQINCGPCVRSTTGVHAELRAPRKDRDGAVPRQIGALRRARVCVQYAETPAKDDTTREGAMRRLPQSFHSRQPGWSSLLALFTARQSGCAGGSSDT